MCSLRKSSSLDSLARDDPELGRSLGRGSRRRVDDLEAALEQFREIAEKLSRGGYRMLKGVNTLKAF